jgi:hypothetical membrane protein
VEVVDVMGERGYAVFGLAGPLVAFFFIALSIGLSPGFSWQENALSDLGHATRSSVAPWFNFGLFFAGFLVVVYAVTVLAVHARFASYGLLASAVLLQLVAVFDEVYGGLHFFVSVLFFISFGLASLVFAVEKRSFVALVAFVIGLCSWAFYFAGLYGGGIAIPEAISSAAAVSWVVSSAIRTLQLEQKVNL